jgi:acyl-CoA synthetase (AMP-forming)/AMP-acid ligase II
VINSRHTIKKDALVKVDNHENSSSTSKSDYKSYLVQKLMLHNHGVGDGMFKSISTGTEVVLSG